MQSAPFATDAGTGPRILSGSGNLPRFAATSSVPVPRRRASGVRPPRGSTCRRTYLCQRTRTRRHEAHPVSPAETDEEAQTHTATTRGLNCEWLRRQGALKVDILRREHVEMSRVCVCVRVCAGVHLQVCVRVCVCMPTCICKCMHATQGSANAYGECEI